MMLAKIKHTLISQNALFGLGLGLCPTLAISTTLKNGIGMGLAVAAVLIITSGLIGLFKKAIPHQIRIPVVFIIIATVVTVVAMLIKVISPVLSANLGIYVLLIAVNCIILGRVEMVAFQVPFKQTLLDALVTGAGYFIALAMLSALREILGFGSLLGIVIVPFKPLLPIAALPTGGLLVFALLLGLLRSLGSKKAAQSL
jgi:electron transport complex protein RnfE